MTQNHCTIDMWYDKHIGVHVVSESIYWYIRVSRGFCLDVYMVLTVIIIENFTVDLKCKLIYIYIKL